MSLSVVMITRNSAGELGEALASVEGLWDELLVGDAGSTDGTIEIAKRYRATIVKQREGNLGARKQALIERAKGDWILVLDSDERVSKKLYEEIHRISSIDKLTRPRKFVNAGSVRRDSIVGYKIQYQNYVFGKPVYFGGERYSKVRMFRRGYGRVTIIPIHEDIIVDGPVGELTGVIHHHSYRTISQLFAKFTHYAHVVAKGKKNDGERMSVKKLFLYGPHMFWSRYIKEQGYKDGFPGLVLAVAFAYMEALTYWICLFLPGSRT